MADTARSLSALQALLPDNTSQDISPQDIRDFLVSVLDLQAGLQDTGSRTVTSTDAGATNFGVAHLTGIAALAANTSGFSVTTSSGVVTAPVTGVYQITWQMQFSGIDTGEFTFSMYLDGSPISGWSWSYDLAAASVKRWINFTAPLDITANSDIQVYHEADDTDITWTSHFWMLWLKRIG